MTLDKATLLARRIGEGEHEIPGFGTVRIRGLSRAEVIDLQKISDVAASDRRMVSLCLLDPVLTEDEVGIWQVNSGPMEIEDLTVAIRDLSGMGKGAQKSGVPSV
jgi:hypothetical protein